MDEDLNQMTREELIDEVMKLRHGIRQHRDTSLHNLCWYHPALWGLLPEKTDPIPMVPEWPEFIRGCVRYRQSLDEQAPNARGQISPMKGNHSRLTASTVLDKEAPRSVKSAKVTLLGAATFYTFWKGAQLR